MGRAVAAGLRRAARGGARAGGWLAPALLAACASAPDLRAPPAPPQTWLDGEETAQAAPVDAWWRAGASDAALQDLLARAAEVEDVEAARARLREAEARARAARSALLPSLEASGEQSTAAPRDAIGYASTTGSLSATLPLDLAGGERARAASARASAAERRALLASARLEARRTAGDLYITMRTAQAQRIAAEKARAAAENTYSLAFSRVQAGLESGLDEAQARSARDAARANPPDFSRAEAEARFGLEALLGLPPGALREPLAAPAPVPTLDAAQYLAQPATILARRPDLSAAAARLEAAGLDARAARADLWPQISLQALYTTIDATSGAVNTQSGQTASGGVSITAPLFNFGRLRALAKAAGAAAEAEAALYRQAVTEALSEVETQRFRIARAAETVEAQTAALNSARDQAEIALARYTSGLADFIDVLSGQTAVYEAESALAGAQGEAARAQVALADALGLGQEE